ncbi:hypothetical protein, partial [Escherichia coli]|uniref:hypothetical protein n=1 Tax=Escherichia coli TaxID=562 RepID=UPI002E1A0051|nr:hypothetical protein [Escherichia coli]
EYLPGSLQGKISSDGCLKKEQMVVSAIASTPQSIMVLRTWTAICPVVMGLNVCSLMEGKRAAQI